MVITNPALGIDLQLMILDEVWTADCLDVVTL